MPTTAQVKRLGGTVHMPPSDIPDVGRFAVVADPQGATFMLFKPVDRRARPASPTPGTPGHVGWHELYATDWEKAFAFYSDLFGWQKDAGHRHGPDGHLPALLRGRRRPIGGMFNKPPEVPVRFWLYYFNVDDIDAAIERVTAGGGKILNGPDGGAGRQPGSSSARTRRAPCSR